MAKKTEQPVTKPTRAELIAERMAARIRESDRLAAEFEASRDPRELVAS